MRISLRYKILFVLGALLLVSVFFYTVLASFIFFEQKTALLFDLNHSVAVNTASQLKSSLSYLKNQLQLFTLANIIGNKSELQVRLEELESSHIVGIGIFDSNGQKIHIEYPSISEEAEKEFFEKIKTINSEVIWRSTVKSAILVTSVQIKINSKLISYFAVAELNMTQFFDTLKSANIFKSYLVSNSGDVIIACSGSSFIDEVRNIAKHPLLEKALLKTSISGVLTFQQNGKKWYGAYAPIGIGNLFYLSESDHKEVSEAILLLVQRSILFGLIVITVAFLASIIFSKRLTKNLKKLTSSVQQIEKGNFDCKINIASKDEIHELATSFNSMLDSLKASREEIERYNTELEDKVRIRTKELEERNATIKEVQEKLLKATELAAIGETAGRTAHELLNPLTAILSRLERSYELIERVGGKKPSLPNQFSEIVKAWENDYKKGGITSLVSSLIKPSKINPKINLLEEDLDNLKSLSHMWQYEVNSLSNDLKFIREESLRIARIVDGMRELIRSSTKTLTDCHEAINEAIGTLTDFFRKNNVNINVKLEALEKDAFLNRDEFIQIVVNLLRNAYDAILVKKVKEGKIDVVTYNNGTFLFVDIIDNGIGIEPKNTEHIFEQGFTTKSPEKGTGLGLAICRRYAHAFGGEVELLFSEPTKRGTAFRITIPLRKKNARVA